MPGRDKEIKNAVEKFNQQVLNCDNLHKKDFESIFESLLKINAGKSIDYLKMKQHRDRYRHLLNVDIAYNYRSKLVEQAYIRQLLSTISHCYKHAARLVFLKSFLRAAKKIKKT